MRYRFVTCDVFTTKRFSGNQLAVLPDATGLDAVAMQSLAAEFGYSETTFVLPPADSANLAAVRIFTPRSEMPFAGHPTVGTALTLSWEGRAPVGGEFVLEMKAGLVPVRLRVDGEVPIADFAAPQRPSHGTPLPTRAIARALGLAEADVVSGGGLPCIASCGVAFLLVELVDLAAVQRARFVDLVGLPETASEGIFLFARDAGAEGAVRPRMFAPLHGIPEDPATGSAAAALAGFLGGRPGLAEGWHHWHVRQGVEMGRPSEIHAAAHRIKDDVVEVRIAGSAVSVAEGTVEVGA
jgi:trans-2,3-dihydro-3-hydroxyanthranilate isomerase